MCDGDIVAAKASGTVIRVAGDGSHTTIAAGLQGYGLAVGNDGNVYVATNYTSRDAGIARIDPDTSDLTFIVEGARDSPRAIDFSADFSTLYFGTTDSGDVYKVALDANLDPISSPEVIVRLPKAWHDTLLLLGARKSS